MIALLGYQFSLYRRSRYWILPVVSWFGFLIAFYSWVVRAHPGSYGSGAGAVFWLALGLSWTFCLSQDEALWQISVVSAGRAERVQVSRILLCWLMIVPLALIGALVTAGSRLGDHEPLPAVTAGFVLYLLVGLVGCALGAAAGRRTGPGWFLPVCVVVLLGWLIALT